MASRIEESIVASMSRPRDLKDGEEITGRLVSMDPVDDRIIVNFAHDDIVLPYSTKLLDDLKKLLGSAMSIARLGNEFVCIGS